jgi:hypothetical protein
MQMSKGSLARQVRRQRTWKRRGKQPAQSWLNFIRICKDQE